MEKPGNAKASPTGGPPKRPRIAGANNASQSRTAVSKRYFLGTNRVCRWRVSKELTAVFRELAVVFLPAHGVSVPPHLLAPRAGRIR